MVNTFGTKPYGIFCHMLINLGVLKLYFGIIHINLNIWFVVIVNLSVRLSFFWDQNPCDYQSNKRTDKVKPKRKKVELTFLLLSLLPEIGRAHV